MISAIILNTTGICSDGQVKPESVSAGEAMDINVCVVFNGKLLRMLKSVPSMQQLHIKRNAVNKRAKGCAGGVILKYKESK